MKYEMANSRMIEIQRFEWNEHGIQCNKLLYMYVSIEFLVLLSLHFGNAAIGMWICVLI